MLIVYYIGMVLTANVLTYFIGLAVEHHVGSNAGLMTFLALYFFTFWIAWQAAVWLTKPKVRPAS